MDGRKKTRFEVLLGEIRRPASGVGERTGVVDALERIGHALVQNLRRGHYELGVEARAHRRVAVAFTELAQTI